MRGNRSITAGVLIVIALVAMPLSLDLPDAQLSSSASISQDVTPAGVGQALRLSRQALNVVRQAGELALHLAVPRAMPIRAFGGIVDSVTSLHCLLGVFRI